MASLLTTVIAELVPESLQIPKVCWDWHVAQVFATGQRRIRSMRRVGPPRIFKLMRMSAASLGKHLILQVL